MRESLLAGKTAIVTGASSGLGKHFAKCLAEEGAQVILCARRIQQLDDLQTELAKKNYIAKAVRMDVSNETSVKEAFDQFKDEGFKPDILVNNAGIAHSGPSLQEDLASWNRTMDVNLTGCFLVAKEFATQLKESNHPGSIINVASILGQVSKPGLTAYCASKAAVIQMTKSLAQEWARSNIRVNAIAPGYFETDMNRDFLNSPAGQKMQKGIPQQRFGNPEELNGALLLLAGPQSSYMTGCCLTVDGGHSLVVP